MSPRRIINKLTQFVESNDPELRKAAIRVISELRLSSKGIMQALGRCLNESEDGVRLAVLGALARLGARDACEAVVPLIFAGGPLREHAMQVLEAAGPSVVPSLRKAYAEGDFHAKRAIISTLGRIGHKDAVGFLLEILPSEAFELQKHITVQIAEALDRMTTEQQVHVLNLLAPLMGSDSLTEKPQVLATVALLLGHFRGEALATRARHHLRALGDGLRANGRFSPEVWRHVMVSFDRLAQESETLSAPEQKFVEEMLCDEDWSNVAQYALNTFRRIDVPRNKRPALVALLEKSPHFSVHIHVFERLESSDSPEVAKAILPFLGDGRLPVREAAQAALRRIPSAIESLFALLMKTADPEVTQRVNTILRDFPQETRKKYLQKACKRLLTLYEQNDPHYKSFLDFVRGVDAGPLRTLIYQEAWAIKGRKGKDKWKKICKYLELLWDHHLISAEGRYLLGIASLRLNSKEMAPAARRANLGLKVLRALVYDHMDGLVRKLRGDKDLQAEDFYYLGFHFAEEGGEMRPFGMAMLRHVARKFSRTKLGVAARRKLEAFVAEEKKAAQEAAAAKGSTRKSRARAAAAEAMSRKGDGSKGVDVETLKTPAVPEKPAAAAKKAPVDRKKSATAGKASADVTKERVSASSKRTAAAKNTGKPSPKKAGKKTAAERAVAKAGKGKPVKKKPASSRPRSSASRKKSQAVARKKGKKSSKAADSRVLRIARKSKAMSDLIHLRGATQRS